MGIHTNGTSVIDNYCQDYSSVVIPGAEESECKGCVDVDDSASTRCSACDTIEQQGTISEGTSDPDLHLLVIGAGPHALSLLTRL